MPLKYFHWYFSFLWCCLVSAPVYLSAQIDRSGTNKSYHFSEIQSNELLRGFIIHDIVKGKHGFMWFATHEGLVRYDGHLLRIYESDPTDTHSLSSNHTNSLQVDTQGNIWVATRDGLNKFDPIQERFDRFYFDLNSNLSEESNWINKILLDPLNNLWLATMNNGLVYFDTQTYQFKHYKHNPQDPHSIHSNQVFSLAYDHEGALWIGGGRRGSLQHFNTTDSSFTQITLIDPSIVVPDIIEMEITKSGEIWCGTWNEGIFVYDPKENQTTNYRYDSNNADSIGGNIIQGIVENEDGTIWIAVRDVGVDLYEPIRNTFSHFQYNVLDETSIAGNTVISVYSDDQGLVWFGTTHEGVFYYDPEFARFTKIHGEEQNPNGLQSNYIYSLICDQQNNLWIGTHGGGLQVYDPTQQKFTQHFLPDESTHHSISTASITALHEDSKGRIWIGNWSTQNIVDCYDPQTNSFQHYQTKLEGDDTNETTVRVIVEDHLGLIWIGTANQGIHVIDSHAQSVIQYESNEAISTSVSGRNIICLFEDQKKRMWIGTEQNGLNLYDHESNTFTVFRHDRDDDSSISSNKINSIYEDSKGRIWFATDNGLCRWDETNHWFIRHLFKEGLDKIDIRGIIEDASNHLWLSTKSAKLLRLDPFYQISNTFTQHNGVQSLQFRMGSTCTTQNGLLCFGGLNGLNIVDPTIIAAPLHRR